MKNIVSMPVIAVMVLAVLFASGCTTGQFVSVDNVTDGGANETKAVDSSDGFVIEAKIVLDDSVPLMNDTGNATGEEETPEVIETSSRRGGSSGGSPPSEPPAEPEEFSFTVYIDSAEPVRSAEFGLSFAEGTTAGDAEAGEFLKKDGTSVRTFVSKRDTSYILVGLLRENVKTGVSGSGELGTVTFFGYPEDVKLVHAKVMGENINGTIMQNELDAELSGNTIEVQ